MSKRVFALLSILVLLTSVLVGCGSAFGPTRASESTIAVSEPVAVPATPAESQTLILATTTSTQDSGLLDFILPGFEKANNCKVEVIAVGTGQALKLGEDGNADVLLVHARAKEDAFMDAGHGVRREDVMYNDFIIVGPAADPTGIKGLTSAAEAFQKLAQAQAPFVSRGDESGTHTKEKDIWKAAGIEPTGDWYISAGQGMGAVLTMANEQQAYTFSDRATYLARTLQGIELNILVEGDPILFNPYGVIAVNPAKGSHIKADLANACIDWLISLSTQQEIGQFGVDKFASPLFTPDSALWREAHPSEPAQPTGGVPANAALKITGKVAKETGWAEEEVRAMKTMEAQSTNKQGQTETYTGVSLNQLLEMAEVQACQDCIVSFRQKGGFSTVLPGFPGKVQVK